MGTNSMHSPVPEPCMIVVSQTTYHKNDFINEFINVTIDRQSRETKATQHQAEHQGQHFNIVNMPGMHDICPEDVSSVTETIRTGLRTQLGSPVILVFQHPIRWTGEDQDFVHTITEMVGKKTLKSNTFIMIADYNTQDVPFAAYCNDIIKNYSTRFNFGSNIKSLGDLFKQVTPEKIYSEEEICSSDSYKQKFLNCVFRREGGDKIVEHSKLYYMTFGFLGR